jgi:AsmA protein
MAKAIRWRRVALSLALVIVLAAALIGIRATLPKQGELRSQLQEQLALWTGGDVTIEGQTRISLFPRARIEVDRLRIRGMEPGSQLELIDVKTLGAEFGVWSLLQGEPRISKLTLREPQIRINAGATRKSGANGGPQPQLIRALLGVPFTQLEVERGLLVIGGAVSAESISEISANLSISQTGAVSTQGVLTWREQPVNFSLQTGSPNLEAKDPSAPIQITLDGKLITANVDGLATLKDGIRLSGALNLELADTRRFSKWTGVNLPAGTGFGALVVSGDFNWIGMNIAFDNGTFTLDGNRAIGALAIRYDRARPQIEGTLALQSLSLTQYLSAEAAPVEKAEGAGAPSDAPSDPSSTPSAPPTATSLDLSFPLLQQFDLDLRVSATQFEANSIAAGQTALTLTLESGKLAAAYSILDLFDGRSSGQLQIDTKQSDPHLHLTGTMTEIAVQPFIEAFKLESPLQGGMNVEVDVSGNGRNFKQLLQDLSGTIEIAMPAGEVNIDLAKVVAGAAKGDLRGWQAARGQTTGFSDFSANFELERGIARSNDFKMQTGPLAITGEGSIDIAARNLNWRLEIPNPVAERLPRIGALVAELNHSLRIKGPWSDPTFHLERKRADGNSGPAQPVAALVGNAR